MIQILFFGVLLILFESLVVGLIVRISQTIIHLSWNLPSGVLEFVFGPYPNQTNGFSSPADLCKGVAKMPFGCS